MDYNADNYPAIISTHKAVKLLGISNAEFEPLMQKLGIKPILTSFDRARTSGEGKRVFKSWSKSQILKRLEDWDDSAPRKPQFVSERIRNFRQPEMRALLAQ